MKLRTRHVLAALIGALLAFGLAGQMPRDAAAAAAAGTEKKPRVGHTVERIVVPGIFL